MAAEAFQTSMSAAGTGQDDAAKEHAACGCGGQALLPAITGDGLRRLADNSAERDLLARFEFTSFQRGASTLYSCRQPAGPVSAYWFRNAVGGIGVGLSEGLVLCNAGDDVADWAHEVAASSGSSIMRLATATEGELPDEAGSRIESINGSRERTVTRVRMRLREVLRLAPTFEGTLAGMGRHTRRNIRNARKAAAAERVTFDILEGAAPAPDRSLRALAKRTEPHPVHHRRVRAFEAYAEQTGRPFRSVLRAADGAIISYCCGFLGQSAAYLVYQLNDRRWNRIGPSLMHRAFLIEALVQQSCHELVFVHGCSGILRHSCIPMVADHYWVMRRTAAARLRAAALANLLPDHLLGKVARAALQTT